MLPGLKFKKGVKEINNSALDLKFYLKNTFINGKIVGFTGFIKNLTNNKIVYVSVNSIDNTYMYREAISTKDYTGGRNLYSTENSLPESVLKLLV